MRNNPFQVQLGRRTLLTAGLALGASQLAYPFLSRARARSEAAGGTAANAARDHNSAVARFYEERDVTLLVASAPGGINDLVGRLVAEHIVNFIPGKPNIIVQNLRAAGIVLANRLYSDEQRDGSVIAILERSTPQLAIIGDPNVRFDPLKLTWLGSVSSYAHDAYVLEVNSTFPAKTATDLKVPGGPVARVGTTGAGSTNAVFTDICKDVLRLNIDNIRGYRGAAGVFLAQERGELDGQIVGFSSLKAGQATLWQQGFFRPLIAFGRSTRLPELPDVPTGHELTKDPEALALIEFAEAPFHMALPFVAPPNVPTDRAKALQTAFMETTKSPAFVHDAQKLSLDVSPIDGEAVLRRIEMMERTPKEVIARYTSIVPLSD